MNSGYLFYTQGYNLILFIFLHKLFQLGHWEHFQYLTLLPHEPFQPSPLAYLLLPTPAVRNLAPIIHIHLSNCSVYKDSGFRRVNP